MAAARELAGQRVCFVGVGLPNIAVNLAQRTVAPDLQLVYESGVFGARPARLPLSIGDPTIVTGATAVTSMLELFGYYLQRGLSTSASWAPPRSTASATSTPRSSATTTHPTTRLPGSGGACEIAINARKVFVIMRQSKRSFVERIDFRTSPGNLGGAEAAERIRREQGWMGAGHRWWSRTWASTTSTRTARCASTRSTRARRSSRSATRWAGRWRWRRTWRRPRRPPPRAAAHPRGARSGGRLHQVGDRPRRPVQPLEKLTRNSSVPLSAIETISPPMFGATIE